MSAKTILLAIADPQALIAVTEALGSEWMVVSASNEADTLVELEQQTFVALVVDFNLGSPNASDLLNQAFETCPDTRQFLLAHEADLALVAAYVTSPHEILPKPIEPVSLKSRIERGTAPEESTPAQSESARTGANAAPPVPTVYAEVLKVLDSPTVTCLQVGELIAGDAALTAELLRLTKSAYQGLPSDLTDPALAVEALGLDAVKALVMARQFLAEHSQLRPGYFSIENIWQHSTQVAQLARDLILFETKNQALASEALAAGLLHDLGKVVLASNFADLYGRVYSLARKQPVALWDIEKEMFGANHGEIGACLVGMWNMPLSVVTAVALHHEPPLGEDQELSPLAAVHIANVLEYQISPSDEFRVAPVVFTPYLSELGLLQRLPVWRAVFANRHGSGPETKVKPAQTSQSSAVAAVGVGTLTANEFSEPAAATQSASSGQSRNEAGISATPVTQSSRWIYAGAGAAVLALLAFVLVNNSDLTIRAHTRNPQPDPAVLLAPSAPTLAPVSAVVPEAAAKPATAMEIISVPNPAAALPEPIVAEVSDAPATPAVASELNIPKSPLLELAFATVAEAAPEPASPMNAAAVPSPLPAPVEASVTKIQPEFRLNGIIYMASQPMAIVNHKTVFVGDSVSGAKVAAIDRTGVTLQINGRTTRISLQAVK